MGHKEVYETPQDHKISILFVCKMFIIKFLFCCLLSCGNFFVCFRAIDKMFAGRIVEELIKLILNEVEE